MIAGFRALGPRLAWWMLFLVVGFVAHGALLLDDGRYLDDWWSEQWIQEGRFTDMLFWQMASGQHLLGWFHWSFLVFPNMLVGQKVFVFAMLVVSAGLVAKICQSAGFASPREALAIGLLSLAAPAHRALSVFSVTGYVLGHMALFLTATLLVLRAEALRGASRWRHRSLALALFWLSFYLNSLLVPYVGLGVGLALCAWRRGGYRTARTWLLRHWVFLALPFAFWSLKLLYIYGLDVEGTGYNQLRWWDPAGIVRIYVAGLRTYSQMAWTWVRPGTLLLGGALVAATYAWRAFRSEVAPRRHGVHLILGGAALGILGLFPYAAVGKGLGPPGAHWDGHYGVLLGPPLALLAVGLLVTIFGGLTRAASALALTLLGAWCFAATATHLHWQAEAIKWHAVCQQAGKSPVVRQSNIIVVVDEWRLGMHNILDGGTTGRHGRFGAGMTPFFHHFCAPGAPKVAREVDLPMPVRSRAALEAAIEAALDSVDEAARAGLLSDATVDAVRRGHAAADGPEAVRAELLRHWLAIRAGLAQAESHQPTTRTLRQRILLRLAGFAIAPAIPSRIWDEEATLWVTLMTAAPPRTPPRLTLVLVRPGRGYKAVPDGHSSWWRQARRLWLAYQHARFLGTSRAATTLLDEVATVEVLRLTE